MSAEADIGRAVRLGLERAWATRRAQGDPLRSQIAAILAEHPDWSARRIQWRLPPRTAKLRRVQQVIKEVRSTINVARSGPLQSAHGGT